MITPKGTATKCKNVTVLEGTHPIASKLSINSTKKMLGTLEGTTSNDLVIFLLSGGASSLLELLNQKVSLAEYQELIQSKLLDGANIQELNEIRKQYSLVKSGKLLQDYIRPAMCLNIVLSDVWRDDPNVIGSAPTYTPVESPLRNLWW